MSALFLNKVSTPPKDCWSLPPSINDDVKNLPIAATATTFLKAATKLPPALLPVTAASPFISLDIIPEIPLADGMI